MIIKNHELCRKILRELYHLRNDLKELEKQNPSLFNVDDPSINSNWEFWTTDEILERIYLEIDESLKISENFKQKEMHNGIHYEVVIQIPNEIFLRESFRSS